MRKSIGNAKLPLWLIILPSILISPMSTAKDNSDALIFEGDFESGELKKWVKELGWEVSAQIITKPVRAGKHSVRFELRKDDPIVASSKRAELALKKEPKVKVECWCGFSIFLPEDYNRDGLLEVWKNSRKVIRYEGLIGYNDEHSFYFKTGIYKWVWNMTPEKDLSTTDKRVIFVDEVRIGCPNATYQDVALGRDNAAKKETDRDDK